MSLYNIYAQIIPLMIILTSFNVQSMFRLANRKPIISNRPYIPTNPKDQYEIQLESIAKNLPDNTIYIHEEKNSFGAFVSKQVALKCIVIKNINEDIGGKLIPVPYCGTTIQNFVSVLENSEKKDLIIQNCSFNELIDILLLNEHLSGPSDYLNEKFNTIVSSILIAYNTTIHNVELAMTEEITYLKSTNPPSYIFMTKPQFRSDNIKKEFIDSLKQIPQFSNEREDFRLLKSLVQMSPTESLYEALETKNIQVSQKKSIYKELEAKKITLNMLMEDLERLEKEHKVASSYMNLTLYDWFNNQSN